MAPLRRLLVAAMALCLLLQTSPAYSTWSTDPTQNNLVSAAAYAQYHQKMIQTESGDGAIIVWVQDLDDPRLFAQKIDNQGVPQWGSDRRVCTYDSDQEMPEIISDGADGCIAAWIDTEGPEINLYAQRIGADGTLLWSVSGQPVCTAVNAQYHVRVVPDGKGGAIFAWYDLRSDSGDIYMQRLDATGAPQWGANGLAVCTETGQQAWPELCAGEAGDSFVAWSDGRVSPREVYVQRMDLLGNALWTPGGVGVIPSGDPESAASLCTDGTGGVYIAFESTTGSVFTALGYVARMDATGDRVWYAGYSQQAVGEYQYGGRLAPDGTGGAFLVFFRGETSYAISDVRAQRFTSSGALLWGTPGVRVTDLEGTQYYPGLAPDGCGGLYVTWADSRLYRYSIYAQRLDVIGRPLWIENGMPVSLGNSSYSPVCYRDGAGGLVVAWTDMRDGEEDIYAQRLDPNGLLGDALPTITTVADFPADQGGQVLVDWDAPYFDNLSWRAVESYSVWARDAAVAKAAVAVDIKERDNLSEALGWASAEVESMLKTGWTHVTELPALFESSYSALAFSFGDSTENGVPLTEYRVIAHGTESHIFWESAVASGYSVDNLSPGAPLDLDGDYVAAGEVGLDWQASGARDEDLHHYEIYRGDITGFPLDASHRVGSSTTLSYLDVTGGGNWYYRVTARDVHGNESPPTPEILVTDATAAPELPVLRTAFRGNHPNPFNPCTVFRFELAERARVRVSLYSVAGRLVRELVDESLDPGRYERLWDGRDLRGGQLPSGVYLVRMLASGEEFHGRAVLLK